MKKILHKTMYISMLALISLWGIMNAQLLSAGICSYETVLIGKFVPVDEKGNSKTFDLWTGEEYLRFTVTQAYNLSGAGGSGWRRLSDIFPRKINLFGGERVTAPLKQEGIVGRSFKLRGSLYVNAKRFHLNIVEEVMEE